MNNKKINIIGAMNRIAHNSISKWFKSHNSYFIIHNSIFKWFKTHISYFILHNSLRRAKGILWRIMNKESGIMHRIDHNSYFLIRNSRKPAAIAIAFLIILTVVVIAPTSKTKHAAAAWFSQDWNYRQKIIIDHNKVPNTDQTDFPVLIKITDANNPIFSSKVQDDGDDIRFTSTDQATILNHEIESYSKTTHELWAWVKVPTLSHETDTTIYLYYGNQTAEAPTTESKQAVWSNGYAGVWHMGDNNGLSLIDSTSGSNTGTASNVTSTAGKVGNGANYADSSVYRKISIGSPSAGVQNINATDQTWEVWLNSADYRQFSTILYMNTSGLVRTKNSQFGLVEGGNVVAATVPVSASSAYHLVGTRTGTTYNLYVNGSLSSQTFTADIGYGTHYYIGGAYNDAAANAFAGIIDEARVSSSVRSADWIATEYANQNSPETFFQIRSEVSQVTAPLQAGPTGWYDLSWGNRQPIILNNTHDKVPNTNQTDFPVLVKITDPSNELFAEASVSGNDILFTSADGTTKLAHEVEKYDAATHELWAWVKIPTLLTGADTNIYMYYGNSLSPSQQSKTAVWSNGYAGVWHLGEDPSLAGAQIKDSSIRSNHATSSGSMTIGDSISGRIGNGLDMDNNDYLTAGPESLLNGLSQFTFSAYAYSKEDGKDRWLLSRGSTASDAELLWADDVGAFSANNIFAFNVGATGVAQNRANALAETRTLNEWHYISGAMNGTAVKIFVDGQLSGSSVSSYNVVPTRSDNLMIGSWAGNQDKGLAMMDEIRVSTVARSADWIATEYNNQSMPEDFMSFGTTETADSFAPSNPTTITALQSSGGAAITNNSGTDSTPYYSWPEPEVSGGASDQTGQYISGVAGYYSYFGTSCGASGADPYATRGLLTDTGSGLHYSSDTNISVPDLTTNQGSYCLRLKTRDIAGNISSTTEVATYNFDLTNPNPPTFVAVNPAGYSSTDNFDFTWPAATDNANGSGIQGYQYKRGNGTDEWSQVQSSSKITDITHYNETGGENIFLVRSVDNAGNVSAEVQTTYYYSANPPTKPLNLTASPSLSDENDFSFAWDQPANPARPIVSYGYSINASPTTENITWTGTSATTLASDSYATIQGANTLYLVAKDDSGAYSFSDQSTASVSFNCTTVAPSAPVSVSITDSSNRAYETYSLTLKWSPGANQSLSFSHYLIERSIDNETFTPLATTSSTAYIDVNNLSNTTTYYYRVKAIDNANSSSAPSQTVSRIPTGKYQTPPTILEGPESSTKASTATIKWVTNRSTTAGVRFGTDRNNLSRSQIDPTESTQHSITIPGLEGGTKYYYQVQSLDNERDYSSEDAYSATTDFETLALPVIADVKISNITLNSADLSWTTSTASNTKLSYGTTLSYGTDYEDQDSYTTNHTYKLKDLAHTTTYHFKLEGIDQDGNTLISDDYVFDTLPMPKISAVNFETDLKGTEPKSYITWTTNVATTSSVDYTPKNASAAYEESQSSYVTSHKVELSKLSDNTSYSFHVYGSDQFGNKTSSDEYSFSTPFDSRAAIITNVSVEASNVGLNKQDKAQIVVSWHTDEPASTQVEYGEGVSGNYTNKTSEDKTLTNEHFVIISDLKPSTPYHFKAISKDKGNNLSESEDINTVPGEVPKSVIQTILQSFNSIFGWVGRLI